MKPGGMSDLTIPEYDPIPQEEEECELDSSPKTSS